jgi:hypothetical protein
MDVLFALLCCSIFVVATVYSAIGHGGGSSYIALFVLFNLAPAEIRPTALLLNVVVSSVATWQFYSARQMNLRLMWPFLAGSIPAAFAGGLLHLDTGLYKKILGVFLLLVTVRLFLRLKGNDKPNTPPQIPVAVLIGAVIGFISGIIGIGGGIILSPIIILMNWGNTKEAASTSAVFILLNSIAGLLAIHLSEAVIDPRIYLMGLVVLAGGFLGSYMGSRKLNAPWMNAVLGVVTLAAALKLL